MIVIGISGKSGSGKTFAKNFITKKYGFVEYSFASPLKKIGLALGFKKKQLYGTQEEKLEINEEWGISGREFMIKFGTEICRDALPSVIPQMEKLWIKCFEIFINKIEHENKRIEFINQYENGCKTQPVRGIIIDDVRFKDEVKFIQKVGVIIKLVNFDDIMKTMKITRTPVKYNRRSCIEFPKIESPQNQTLLFSNNRSFTFLM